MSFPELDRLAQLFDLTDKELDRRKVIRGAKRESFKRSTRCEKCLWYFTDEEYDTHNEECRWVCGLCGAKYNIRSQFYDHTMQCARSTTTEEPTPGTSSFGPH